MTSLPPRVTRVRHGVLMLSLLSLAAHAEDLHTLLGKGPVTMVETKADGHVERVTAIAKVPATPDVVYARLAKFEDYTTWMPQVEQSEVVERLDGPPSTAIVEWSIAAPGPNVNFTAKYTLDPVAHTIAGEWQKGALEGSTWEWRIVADGAGSLVYRVAYNSAVSDNWLLSQFDDSSHTLELGLNAATPIVELNALTKAVD
jgi:ribosome-associated toxin RatA of RatAB toxin-antitoxin module